MSKKLSPFIWVNTTYFAEGLPYMLVRIVSGIFFTDIGAKERYIGYLNFLGIPWNLKFLWAPLLDGFGSKRGWMGVLQILLGILSLVIAAINFFIPSQELSGPYLIAIAIIFIVMGFLAATNDVAVDGYYMDGLKARSDQAAWSGHRVMAYRIAMVFARSGLVAIAGIGAAEWYLGQKFMPWVPAFALGGITLLVLGVFHLIKLEKDAPSSELKTKSSKEAFKLFRTAFQSYLVQDRAVYILLFIVLYKIGDEILFSMVTPFLIRELEVTKIQYSWIGGIVGAVGSVIGAMVGGLYIKKVGLKKAVWPLTLFMNLNIWAYIALAYYKPSGTTPEGLFWIASVHGYEQFAAGIRSAVLLIFLLGTCNVSFKASHYAIGSAIMTIPSTFLGGFAGRLVENIGYLNLFLIAFAASLPGMLLINKVPLPDETPAPQKPA